MHDFFGFISPHFQIVRGFGFPRFRGGLTHVLLRAVAKQGTTSARFAWSGAGTKESSPRRRERRERVLPEKRGGGISL